MKRFQASRTCCVRTSNSVSRTAFTCRTSSSSAQASAISLSLASNWLSEYPPSLVGIEPDSGIGPSTCRSWLDRIEAGKTVLTKSSKLFAGGSSACSICSAVSALGPICRRGKVSRGASLTRPVSDVDEFGVIASAPAQALSFANAKSLRRNSHATSTAPVYAKDRQARPRPMSLNSSTPSDRGVLGPEDRVKVFVAEPEAVNPLSGVVEAGVDLPILESMVASTSPMTGKSDENQQAPSSVGIDVSPAPRRGGWSLLKRHRKVR